MKSLRWGPEEFIGWLRTGFAELERKRHTLDEHLAFLPLRFQPESSALGQLLAFLNAACRDRSRLAEHIRMAVHEYLKDYVGIRMDDEERAFVVNLWRVYPALGPGADLVALARKYVNAFAESNETPDGTGELVDVIVLAVASTPLNKLQMSFFMHLAERTKLWRDSYMLLFADRYLQWSPTPRQGWCELRLLLEPETDAALDPSTASGRALIGLLGSRLFEDDLPDSLDISGARRLKERMYQLDGEGTGPFMDDAGPEPADAEAALRRWLPS